MNIGNTIKPRIENSVQNGNAVRGILLRQTGSCGTNNDFILC